MAEHGIGRERDVAQDMLPVLESPLFMTELHWARECKPGNPGRRPEEANTAAKRYGTSSISRTSSRAADLESAVRPAAPAQREDAVQSTYVLRISTKRSNANPLDPSPRPIRLRAPSHTTTRPSVQRVR